METRDTHNTDFHEKNHEKMLEWLRNTKEWAMTHSTEWRKLKGTGQRLFCYVHQW